MLISGQLNTVLTACLLGALFTGTARAEYYIYREADGTRWITDHRIGRPDFQLIGRYGRPSASRSCRGVTEEVLEQRALPLLPLVNGHARRHAVDHRLVKAIIAVESCFDTHAVSRVGAQGLMQLMPQTAAHLGVRDPFSPSENIGAGVRYFARLLKRFGNDVKLALAAYNAGPEAVEKYGGIPPYAETRKYVERVLHYYDRYRGLETGAGSAAAALP